MARPKEKAPALVTPGRAGRFMGCDWAGPDFSAATTAAQLLAARYALPLERAALVAALALGGAHG